MTRKGALHDEPGLVSHESCLACGAARNIITRTGFKVLRSLGDRQVKHFRRTMRTFVGLFGNHVLSRKRMNQGR
jgi:hypothetical protein